jgi:hypothetical protein
MEAHMAAGVQLKWQELLDFCAQLPDALQINAVGELTPLGERLDAVWWDYQFSHTPPPRSVQTHGQRKGKADGQDVWSDRPAGGRLLWPFAPNEYLDYFQVNRGATVGACALVLAAR